MLHYSLDIDKYLFNFNFIGSAISFEWPSVIINYEKWRSLSKVRKVGRSSHVHKSKKKRFKKKTDCTWILPTEQFIPTFLCVCYCVYVCKSMDFHLPPPPPDPPPPAPPPPAPPPAGTSQQYPDNKKKLETISELKPDCFTKATNCSIFQVNNR